MPQNVLQIGRLIKHGLSHSNPVLEQMIGNSWLSAHLVWIKSLKAISWWRHQLSLTLVEGLLVVINYQLARRVINLRQALNTNIVTESDCQGAQVRVIQLWFRLLVAVLGIDDLHSINSICLALTSRINHRVLLQIVLLSEVNTFKESAFATRWYRLLDAYSLETDTIFWTLAKLPANCGEWEHARSWTCFFNDLPICFNLLNRGHQIFDRLPVEDFDLW